MEHINKGKMALIALGTGITLWLGNLAIPVYIMLAFSIFDYISGLKAAKKRCQKIDSTIAREGFVIKVFTWLLVVVGVMVDQLLLYCLSTLGIAQSTPFPVAILIAVWICFNELISVIENMNDIIGDKMPQWLLPFARRFKSKVDNLCEVEKENDNE